MFVLHRDSTADENALKELESKGMTIQPFSEEDRLRTHEVAMQLYKENAEKLGGAVMEYYNLLLPLLEK